MVILTPPCTEAGQDVLFNNAAQDAVFKSVQSLDSWCIGDKCKGVIKRIAVWDVDNDRKSLVQEQIQTAIVKTGKFKIYTLGDTADARKILKEKGRQLRYQERYDSAALIELGKSIAPKGIIVGKVQSVRADDASCNLILFAKLLNLKTGEVAWAEISYGQGKKHFTPFEWTWRCLVCVALFVLCVIFILWANWQSLRFAHYWIAMAVIVGTMFWFLVGRYL